MIRFYPILSNMLQFDPVCLGLIESKKFELASKYKTFFTTDSMLYLLSITVFWTLYGRRQYLPTYVHSRKKVGGAFSSLFCGSFHHGMKRRDKSTRLLTKVRVKTWKRNTLMINIFSFLTHNATIYIAQSICYTKISQQ